jgi:hypothetical protein
LVSKLSVEEYYWLTFPFSHVEPQLFSFHSWQTGGRRLTSLNKGRIDDLSTAWSYTSGGTFGRKEIDIFSNKRAYRLWRLHEK